MAELTREVLDALADYFPEEEVDWKAQALTKDHLRALVVCYIDARSVINRLNRVVGGDWSFDWEALPPEGQRRIVKGRLTVCGVSRSDVGEYAIDPQHEYEMEPYKAAVSDALKRAAVHFGIGAYLYSIPAVWVDYDDTKRQIKNKPRIPPQFLPKPSAGKSTPAGEWDESRLMAYLQEVFPKAKITPETVLKGIFSASSWDELKERMPFERAMGIVTLMARCKEEAPQGFTLRNLCQVLGVGSIAEWTEGIEEAVARWKSAQGVA